MFAKEYDSPLGTLWLTADEQGLTGVRFAPAPEEEPEGSACLTAAVAWLDVYFSGKDPGPVPPLHLQGSDFCRRVWQALGEIPYGCTLTYGQLAQRLNLNPGAARAVGRAVGKNPILLLVPCHRVVGVGGRLGGYSAGPDRKQALLELEK